jgi:hypothetical protein
MRSRPLHGKSRFSAVNRRVDQCCGGSGSESGAQGPSGVLSIVRILRSLAEDSICRVSGLKCRFDAAHPSNRALGPPFRRLTATILSSLVSRAFHTSPIPPARVRFRISYGPSSSPAAEEGSIRNHGTPFSWKDSPPPDWGRPQNLHQHEGTIIMGELSARVLKQGMTNFVTRLKGRTPRMTV